MPGKRPRDKSMASPGNTDPQNVSRRRKDAAAFASRVHSAVESMQRGRKLAPLSENTRNMTLQAIRNAVPMALRSLPGQRQKDGALVLRDLSAGIAESLEALESPATWCVGKEYALLSSENVLWVSSGLRF
eukprot:TRINITY_DN11786_c0_g1_i13.p1 TRINITY_DN11786_c0_g1~~TRINITY_DN11786_c0_g1_i13.p1  ORF type:complete len:131 (-),score=21.43 TRINITY_DN11786_c0_g1_i13:311-703(-)